jgi:hypothetical protein
MYRTELGEQVRQPPGDGRERQSCDVRPRARCLADDAAAGVQARPAGRTADVEP